MDMLTLSTSSILSRPYKLSQLPSPTSLNVLNEATQHALSLKLFDFLKGHGSVFQNGIFNVKDNHPKYVFIKYQLFAHTKQLIMRVTGCT